MSLLIRLMVPLVGYLCVATVVTAAMGFGYLRHKGVLSDETIFRVMALVHGVDLEKITDARDDAPSETPPEEPSFEEQQQHAQVATIRFDAKRKQLADSLLEFDFQLKRLTEETNRYAMLGESVEQKLKKQKEQLLTDRMLEVRTQIEVMNPKKQAKPILVKMIEDKRIDEVILLLGSMKTRSRRDILNTFDTEMDIDMLYSVQEQMLAGGAAAEYIDERLRELQQLKNQGN